MFKSLWQFVVSLLSAQAHRQPTPPVAPTIPTPPTIPTATPAPVGAMTEAMRQELLDKHNAARAGAGVAPLVRSSTLDAIASAYAARMASDRVMSHADRSTLEQRLQAGGYDFAAAGENIAEGYPTVGAVMAGWFQSPGHYANIVGPQFVEVGFGLALDPSGVAYWCADFGAPLKWARQFREAMGTAPTRAFRDRDESGPVCKPPALVHRETRESGKLSR